MFTQIEFSEPQEVLGYRWHRVEYVDLPLVNATRWLRSENWRIFCGTRNAARLANRSLRREKKARHQRGWWM